MLAYRISEQAEEVRAYPVWLSAVHGENGEMSEDRNPSHNGKIPFLL